MKKIKIALVGFGGIARSHYISLEALKKADLPIELVAICDANISQFTASVTINSGGFEITLPEEGNIFVAGAKLEDGKLLTSGGRVLGAVGRGETLENAISKAYALADRIHFENAYCRKDIGKKALMAKEMN